MPIAPAHPAFCDPRVCTADDVNLDHASEPFVWDAGGAIDDVRIEVGRSRYDELFDGERLPGEVTIRVAAALLGGPTVAAHITTTDARLLAAALLTEVERFDGDG